MKKICLLSIFIQIVFAKSGYGPTDQEWGFVTVRKNAHMFWWLHYTTAGVVNVTDRPLIIWLQGGPGGSSTGFGNFGEIGPIDISGNIRNTSWVKYANILFVDNPVGTGFSYVENDTAFATNNKQIGTDFVELLKSFMEQLPKFKKVPIYIFSESYGGKMAVDIALAVDGAVKEGYLECQMKGIGLGDSWISPIDSVLTWAKYLKNLDMIDNHGYEAIQDSAKLAQTALDNNQLRLATAFWGLTENAVEIYSGVDFYNVLTKFAGFSINNKEHSQGRVKVDDLDALMNGPVRETLNISTQWGEQSDAVFQGLYEDFMLPVTDVVENILNNTNIIVAVYNGQLDLIVDVIGTTKWLNNLQWEHSSEWPTIHYQPFAVDGWVEGYKREIGNLQYFSILRSGHMVPLNNPAAMSYILGYVTNNFTVDNV